MSEVMQSVEQTIGALSLAAPARPAAHEDAFKVPAAVSWGEMVALLHKALAGDSADIDHIQAILRAYKSDRDDWKRFALFDPHRYTRNLVDDGNGRFNIMLLCWNEGQASSIHDHAGSHCFMKVLDGNLTETLYDPPALVHEGEPMAVRRETTFDTDGVIYISDKIGMHRVANESHTRVGVSMHIYSPPYSECHCYDDRSGHARSSGAISFFSRGGVVEDSAWESSIAEVHEEDN